MKNQVFRKRDKLDIILTDSRPVEIIRNFSYANFYNYLQDSEEFDCLLDDLKTTFYSNDSKLCDDSWHSAPYKFHVYKNKHELRELSILNPLSLIELRFFLEIYDKELILYSSNNSFSVRKHYNNDQLRFLNVKKSAVTYTSDIQYKDDLEASGDYYSIEPFKYISVFQSSREWFQLNRQYQYCGKTDYSKCFDSVYTHAFSWTIADNVIDRKKFSSSKHFLNACDSLLQNMNGSITNGIVIGPEFSRLMVEILMCRIDSQVKVQLLSKGYQESVDYNICRFVDDIFIFANTQELVEHIIRLFAAEAGNYHLHLNEGKRKVAQLPTVWFEWKERIKPVNDYIKTSLFVQKRDLNYLIKTSIRNQNGSVAVLKMMLQDTIADYPYEQAKMVGYILSTIYKYIQDRDEKRRIFNSRNTIKVLDCFLDIIMYIYSFAPTYSNTDRLISILYYVDKEIPDDLLKECLSRVISNYPGIVMNSQTEDIVNLILLLSFFRIELPKKCEDSLISSVYKNENPLLYAMYLLYIQYDCEQTNRFVLDLEQKLTNVLQRIYSDKEFFLYYECWWFFIFIDCPYLSDTVKDNLYVKLKKIEEKFKGKHLSTRSKKLIIQYLLNQEIPDKFFKWKLNKGSLLESINFKTHKRTIFNGYKDIDSADYDY